MYIQPSDEYFFRPYKLLARRLTDSVRVTSDGGKSFRDGIFIRKMHSLIHDQCSKEKSHPMLLYAWEKSGYDAKDGVIQFDNVSTIDFLISSEDYQYPECQESST